jgi:hypothetical protein
LAAPDRAFAASLCYAKIAPAPLHRGEFARRRCRDAEALGCKLKFEISDFRGVIAGQEMPAMQARAMASS